MRPIGKLTLNCEFKRVYYRAKYKAHPLLVTYALKNRLGHCRIGITTSKKIGNAVKRNRARRIIMAAVREVFPLIEWPCGFDIVLVARPKTVEVKSTDVAKVLQKQMQTLLKSAPSGRGQG